VRGSFNGWLGGACGKLELFFFRLWWVGYCRGDYKMIPRGLLYTCI
jgi:hypothetical protein